MSFTEDGPDDPDLSQPSQERDNQTIKLLVHQFRLCCEENNITVDMQPRVAMTFFLSWLHEHMPLQSASDVCQEAGVSQQIWTYLDDLVNSNQGGMQIQNIWPMICLAARAAPRHKLVNMHVITLLTWEDGTICPISCNTPAVASTHGLNDAICAAQLLQQIKAVADQLLYIGLDGLHDNLADNFGGKENYEVLMGAFIHKIIPNLGLTHRVYAEKYARLIQSLFNPPIPPGVLPPNDNKTAVTQRKTRGGWSS